MEKEISYKGVTFMPGAIRYVEGHPERMAAIKGAIDRLDPRDRTSSYVNAGETNFCILGY